MTQAQIQATPDGAILFDAGVVAQAAFDPEFFEPAHWRVQREVNSVSGGRGGAMFVDAPFGRCVLRHYRRGGMVARVMGDRYLWTGAERTRGFAEFRLLAALRQRDLPVPAPVAARYRRNGVHYRADLITRRIEAAETLAELLVAQRVNADVAARVGAAIATFHAQGAYHADLNAHNVLLNRDAAWLIDFDRGELRAPAREWQLANLARLRRSCRKILCADAGHEVAECERDLDRVLWRPLMAAYESGGAA